MIGLFVWELLPKFSIHFILTENFTEDYLYDLLFITVVTQLYDILFVVVKFYCISAFIKYVFIYIPIYFVPIFLCNNRQLLRVFFKMYLSITELFIISQIKLLYHHIQTLLVRSVFMFKLSVPFLKTYLFDKEG